MENEILNEVVEVAESVDLSQIEALLTTNNELLQNLINTITVQVDALGYIYAGTLMFFGLAIPFIICILLYNFLKKFF